MSAYAWDPPVNTAHPTATIGETVVYPSCQRGDPVRGSPHDFADYTPLLGGTPLLYCRQCGQVRKLEYEE